MTHTVSRNIEVKYKSLSLVTSASLSTKGTKSQKMRLYFIVAALVVAYQASPLVNIDSLPECIVSTHQIPTENVDS